jgi:hypothetical protein
MSAKISSFVSVLEMSALLGQTQRPKQRQQLKLKSHQASKDLRKISRMSLEFQLRPPLK